MPDDVAAVVVGARIDFALKQAARNATSAKPAPRFIPLRGYVSHQDGKRLVDGHAFEVRGFEYCHLWVTQSLEQPEYFVASHWETGFSVGQNEVYGYTPEKVAERAAVFLERKGHNVMRARLAALGVKC